MRNETQHDISIVGSRSRPNFTDFMRKLVDINHQRNTMANNRLNVTTLENWLWEANCMIRVDVFKGDDDNG